MSKHLIIVESPAKCKKIENILGNEYSCLATFGHICELNSLENIDFEKYEKNKYKFINSKKANIDKLEKAIKKTIISGKKIIIATDNDREGEGIAYHLCYFFNLSISETIRILFNEITKKALQTAINNPTRLNINIIHSQQTRQILDLCLGFKISPLLWKFVYYGLSAGRCQTPALNMVYDHEIKLKKYMEMPNYQWNINGIFGDKNWEFKLCFENDLFETKENVNNFLNKCIEFNFYAEKITYTNPEKRYPPLPLITSSLQQICSQIYGFPSKMTMKYAQDLYENGLITYMRTDSTSMSKEFIENTIQYIKNNYGEKFVSSSPFERAQNKSKQKSQEAHECIRVTNINTNSLSNEKFSKNHIQLYEYIWKVSVQTLMSPSQYKKNTLSIKAPLETKFIKHFYYNIFEGFEILNKNRKNDTSDFDYIELYLFSTSSQPIMKYHKIKCENTLSKVPKLLNESMLIKKLEEYNIGRPSTYSSIIQSIENKYIDRPKVQELGIFQFTELLLQESIITQHQNEKCYQETNKYKINEKGINSLNFINEYFNPLFEYEFTNKLEQKLDDIASGNETKYNTCNFYNNRIEEFIKDANIEKIEDKYKIKNKSSKINLGKYDNNSIYLNNGKYGYYLEYKKEKFSIDESILSKNEELSNINFDLQQAINIIIKSKKDKDSKIVREINSEISIRKSEYGDYIYYKTNKMKNPKFINLKNFTQEDYNICETKYIIDYVNKEKNNNKIYKKYKKYKK